MAELGDLRAEIHRTLAARWAGRSPCWMAIMPPIQQRHTDRFIETSTSRERVKAFVRAINQRVHE